jgi:hypothetical protein
MVRVVFGSIGMKRRSRQGGMVGPGIVVDCLRLRLSFLAGVVVMPVMGVAAGMFMAVISLAVTDFVGRMIMIGEMTRVVGLLDR